MDQLYAILTACLATAVNSGSAGRISACIHGLKRPRDMVPSRHPLRTAITATLGVAHGHIYNFTSNPMDLDVAVAILESTVATPGIPDSNLSFQYLFLAETPG